MTGLEDALPVDGLRDAARDDVASALRGRGIGLKRTVVGRLGVVLDDQLQRPPRLAGNAAGANATRSPLNETEPRSTIRRWTRSG